MAALQRSAFFEAMKAHDPQSIAVVNYDTGNKFTYAHVLQDVAAAKERLLKETGKDERSIVGERIAFLVENGYDYVGMIDLYDMVKLKHPLRFSSSHTSHRACVQCYRRPACSVVPAP